MQTSSECGPTPFLSSLAEYIVYWSKGCPVVLLSCLCPSVDHYPTAWRSAPETTKPKRRGDWNRGEEKGVKTSRRSATYPSRTVMICCFFLPFFLLLLGIFGGSCDATGEGSFFCGRGNNDNEVFGLEAVAWRPALTGSRQM